jgi:hypothetical protein
MAENWYKKLFPDLTPEKGAAIIGQNQAAAQQWGNLFSGPGGSMQQGGGGGNPYAGILNEYLSGAKARFAGQSTADAATRDAQIRRYLISYGKEPDFASLGISDQAKGFLSKALNDKTRQLAEQNTAEGTSVYARQEHANALANRRIPAALAGRGLLRSGQTGADLGEQAQAHKNQGFDTLQEMLGGVEGTIGSFLQAERARADALAAAELQAQMAAAMNYGGYMYPQQQQYGPYSAPAPPPPPAAYGAYPGTRVGNQALRTLLG